MRGLVLKTGGRLEFLTWSDDSEAGGEEFVCSDVTADALAYLIDAVRFEGQIYLRDVFSLLECNPTLLPVFARTHAAEYLAESKKAGAVPYTGEYEFID